MTGAFPGVILQDDRFRFPEPVDFDWFDGGTIALESAALAIIMAALSGTIHALAPNPAYGRPRRPPTNAQAATFNVFSRPVNPSTGE